MKTAVAPGTTWEVRLRWGSRRLTAELLGLNRRTLRLGNEQGDDFDTGSAARLRFSLREDGALELTFSAGVTGAVSQAGDGFVQLGQLTQGGRAREVTGERGAVDFVVTLAEAESAKLAVGALTVEVRRARGRLHNLPFDWRVLVLVLLGLVAVAVIIGSVVVPHPGVNPKWVSPKRR